MHHEIAVPLEHAHNRLNVADGLNLMTHGVGELANHLARGEERLPVRGQRVKHQPAHDGLEVLPEPGMELELPYQRELAYEQPGAEGGGGEEGVALDRESVRLDEDGRARLACDAGDVADFEDRVLLAEDAPLQQPEQVH